MGKESLISTESVICSREKRIYCLYTPLYKLDSRNYNVYNKIMCLQESLRVLKQHKVGFNYQVP